MVEREAVYLGTPRQFVTAAEIFGWRLYGQGIERQLGTRYGVDADMHMGGQWLPADTREPVLAFVNLRGLGHIMAQQIGNERTLLLCFCEDDAAWPFVEPWWLDLLAELARLECIEGDAPESTQSEPTQSAKQLTPEQIETMQRLWLIDSYNPDGIAAAMGLPGQGEFVRRTGYNMGLPGRKRGRKLGT